MRLAVLVLWLAPVVAAAEPPDSAVLRAQGEQLARDSHFAEAIDKFKAADRILPSAANACLIALAYTRRELWPQAEIWLATCRERATSADPLPDWTPEATRQIRERLESASVAVVEIVVEPAHAHADVTVSSFALDEKFAPRSIHLPFGRHTIVATARGYEESHTDVVVQDRAPERVVITLHRPMARVPGPRSLRLVGLVGGGAGLVTLGAAVAFGLAARSDAEAISQRTMGAWTPADKATFAAGQTANGRMIAASIAGGALLATGGILYYVGARTHLEPIVTDTSATLSVAGRF